ncbi:hypothetical protein D9613_003673 [Agrocybe pediades]|uniref:F-box domain-containing protein n=1 Tax=Agrocybe pediades TaxID=84607 RepID=A0A8H4QKG1_9AGAR|nr:hypothetical protein D9613_003673 [Agrocybe pediades]
MLLPIELLHLILAHADLASLKACSLASYAFFLATRRYIFDKATIELCPPQDTNLGCAGEDRPDRLLSFLARSSDNYVAPHITTLYVTGPQLAPPNSDWSPVNEDLRLLLPRLTKLKVFVICSTYFVDWTCLDDALRGTLFRFFQLPTIQHVELQYMRLSKRELALLSHIGSVSLVGVCSAAHEPGSFPSLPSTNPIQLRHLSVTFINAQGARYMMKLAKAASKTLTSLRWLTSPYSAIPDNLHLEILTSAELPCLTHLTIRLPLNPSSLSNFANLFRDQWPGQRLETIEVICDTDALPLEDEISTWDWQEVNNTLVRLAKISLKRFKATQEKHTKSPRRLYCNNFSEPDAFVKQKLLSIFQHYLREASESGVEICG